MTDLNLEELKKAAQNATQGAWELVDFNEGMCPPRPLWGVAVGGETHGASRTE